MTARPSPQRVRAGHVEWLAERCSSRDLAVLATINRLKLVSGHQLERLHFHELGGKSRSVTRWRVLKRLTDWRAILPLDRRQGGAARGSAGATYALDSAGQRLLQQHHQADGTRIRRPGAPGDRSVRHTLAVAELYAALIEQSRARGFEVSAFDAEPASWWPAIGGGWLKPDAYALVETAAVSDHWWVEVDLSTESLPVLKQKIRAYLSHHNRGGTGPNGVMPRVLVTVPDERRARQLSDLARHLEVEGQLVQVVRHEDAGTFLADILSAPDEVTSNG